MDTQRRTMRITTVVVLVLVVVILQLCSFHANQENVELKPASRSNTTIFQVEIINNMTSYPKELSLDDGVTVTVPTYKRSRLLQSNSVFQVLASLEFVKKIIFHWNDVDDLPQPDLINHFSLPKFGGKVVIQIHKENSLLNRFDIDHVTTVGMLHLDDDRCLSKEYIEYGYKVWFKYNGTYPTGFYPRRTVRAENGTVGYGWCGNRNTPFKKDCNLLLPGGGLFTSRQDISNVWKPQYKHYRDVVQRECNGEDLMFNFVMDKPSLLIDLVECSASVHGLHHRGDGHYGKRSHIISEFARFKGGVPMPLKYIGPSNATKRSADQNRTRPAYKYRVGHVPKP